MEIRIDGQSAQQGGGHDGMARQLLDDLLGQVDELYAVGRERVVADDGAAFPVDEHVGDGDAAALVLPGLPPQVTIEIGRVARKSRAVMVIGQQLDGDRARRGGRHPLPLVHVFLVSLGRAPQAIARWRRVQQGVRERRAVPRR